MSLETPTWDKISGGLGSTSNEFGGSWGNLISDYFNGVNIGLLDASKIPIIGTFTRYKFEKLGIFDVDQSHSIIFSADDIDTGSNRKIKFRRMITPFEEDYAVLEALPQPFLNKTIDADLNFISNIENADIKPAAAIATSKLAEGSVFAKTNFANVFTAAQTVNVNTTFPLTLFRPINTAGSSNVLAFDFNNDATPTPARKTFGHFNVINESPVSGVEEGRFRVSLIHAGTVVQMMDILNGTLILGISPAKLTLDPTGLTATRTFTFPNASGRVTIQEITNTFSIFQKIAYDATTHMILHRPVNTVGANHGILFDAMSGAGTPVEIPYAAIYNFIAANGSGVESGEISFQTRQAGSFAERMRIIGNTLRVGPAATGVILDPTGLTSVRTNTYPDVNIKLLGEANTASITNKVYDERLNTSLRYARKGRYVPSLEVGVLGEGALQGLVSYGTKATSNQNTAGKYDIWNTLAVTDAIAGVAKLDSFTCQRISNPIVRFAFLYAGSTTNRRVFKGLGSRRLITMNSNTAPLNTAEPGIFVGYIDGVDTQWQVYHNDASGACVKDTTGINIPAVGTNYIVEIQATDSTPNFIVTFYSVTSPGARGAVIGTPLTITADIPAQTTSLYLQDLVASKDGSVQANNIHYIEVGN